ncbi:MAG: hypothetical protein ACM3RP_01445 [Chitinophagales bacterium]
MPPKRHWLTVLILLALLMLGLTPAALADDLRVTTLAGLDWIIDDDVNYFLNPAASAWLQQGLFSATGMVDEMEADAGRFRYSEAQVQVLVPAEPAGQPSRNVVGGRVTLF